MFNQARLRINKFIADSGLCSRRDADRFVEQGNVYINGKRAQLGDTVKANDLIKVNGQIIEPPTPEHFVLIALNKPVGIVSTTEDAEKNNIVDFVNHSARIFPIGRLDKDSQGLILLTNKGDWVNKILRAHNQHEKEYIVTLNKPFPDDFLSQMADGVPILGTRTKKCRLQRKGPNVFSIVLVQGLNRQIRRMCDYFGYEVTRLERVRIMNISLKGLALGDWRDLTQQELAELEKLVAKSTDQAAPVAKAVKSTPAKKTSLKPNKARAPR